MKYIKLFEAYGDVLDTNLSKGIKDIINWDMIEDIKDMALEYIDNGLTLKISINVYHDGKYHSCYLIFNHKTNTFYGKFISDTYKSDNIFYNISFLKMGSLNTEVEIAELGLRVRQAYPNEFINGAKQRFVDVMGKLHEKINENFKDDVNALINLRMIDDVKDMALEYIDDGYTLELKVEGIYSKDSLLNSEKPISKTNYSLTHDYFYCLYEYKFNHNKDYVIRYIDEYKFPNNYPNLRVEYRIKLIPSMELETIYDSDFKANLMSTALINRVKLAYPNETIKK